MKVWRCGRSQLCLGVPSMVREPRARRTAVIGGLHITAAGRAPGSKEAALMPYGHVWTPTDETPGEG